MGAVDRPTPVLTSTALITQYLATLVSPQHSVRSTALPLCNFTAKCLLLPTNSELRKKASAHLLMAPPSPSSSGMDAASNQASPKQPALSLLPALLSWP